LADVFPTVAGSSGSFPPAGSRAEISFRAAAAARIYSETLQDFVSAERSR
jgi:hypothetical protein